jgi:hypothetical protein
MSWVITGTQKTINGTLTLGQSFGGGYFAGYISHTADGNPTHALIVAPRATGSAAGLTYQPSNQIIASTISDFDGVANTAAMVAEDIASYPAANFCVGLNIGGFTDWYLPARYELDIAYFNLKPNATVNNTGWGTNIYAIPRRNSNWIAAHPTQTTVTAFSTGAEAFIADIHWSSTRQTALIAYFFSFNNGEQLFNLFANFPMRVRAFRRIAL